MPISMSLSSFSIGKDMACSILGRLACEEVTSFYSRDDRHFQWYYQIYGASADNSGQRANDQSQTLSKHFLTDIFDIANSIDQQTPFVIIKNGPVGGEWETKANSIDIRDVLTSLWFYYKSGKSPKSVSGERELTRFLLNL
jgi:hypothetical protein